MEPPATFSRDSTNRLTSDSGIAPWNRSAIWPCQKAATVGTDCIGRPSWASCCTSERFLSMSILTSLTRPPAARTTFSRAGVSCLQGPHQVAQKSTRTGISRDASMTSCMKVFWSPSTIMLAADWGDWPINASMTIKFPGVFWTIDVARTGADKRCRFCDLGWGDGCQARGAGCRESAERGRSSGVEHNLAKVGVEGSNPFARSRFQEYQVFMTMAAQAAIGVLGVVNTWSTPTSKCCGLLRRGTNTGGNHPNPVAAETRESAKRPKRALSLGRVRGDAKLVRLRDETTLTLC